MELAWPSKFFAKSKSRLEALIPATKNEKTYILPTRFGSLFAGLCLVLLYSSFATGNNLMYLYTFFLTSLGFSSLWLTHINISELSIDSIEVEDTFADAPCFANVTIYNRSKKKKSSIRIYHDKENPILIEDVPGQSSKTIRVLLGQYSRGQHTLPRIHMDSTFPFSLLTSWKNFRSSKTFLIFPRREGRPRLPFSTRQGQSEEGRISDQVRSPDAEFTGHRKFENSDSPRHIDWKAFARTERLLIKDYQGYRPQEVHLNWDQTQTLPTFEARLSQMALWVDIAETKGFFYSLSMSGLKTNADRGQTHYLACLRHLALAQNERS